METQGVQIGKKGKKNYQKNGKKPSAALSVCSRGLGHPHSQISQRKVWSEGAGTFPKNISQGNII